MSARRVTRACADDVRLADGAQLTIRPVRPDDRPPLARDEPDRACVGVARFVRVAPAVAEPAVVVADRWQHRGPGTALLERLGDATCESHRLARSDRRFAAPRLARA
jgi:hypothetical protein